MQLKVQMKKELLTRFAVFVAVIYVVIPTLFWLIEKQLETTFQLNFFYFAIFSLLMIGMFGAYNRKRILKYKFRTDSKEIILFSVIAVILFGSYFWIKFGLTVYNPTLVIAFSYALYSGGFLAIAVAVFGSKFFKTFRNSIAATAIITYVFFMGTVAILWQFGFIFSEITARIAHLLLSQTNSLTGLATGVGDPSLNYGTYEVIIGAPCSGVESIALFLGISLLAFSYDWKRIKWKKSLIYFSFGLIGIFFVNVIRVSSLMIIGNKNKELANTLFHNNLGWVFFVIYAFLFLFLIYPKLLKKET